MIEINKIIVLENKEQYLVLDKINSNGEDYYYIAKLNDSETDIENNYKLITIIEKEGSKIINEVVGEDKLREILPLFSNEGL